MNYTYSTLSNEPTNNIKVAAIDDRIAIDELVISIGTTETISLIGLKGMYICKSMV